MVPRFADPRIGYFSTAYVDIGLHRQNMSNAAPNRRRIYAHTRRTDDSGSSNSASDTGSGIGAFEVDPKRRIINRWRLEKDLRLTCDEADTMCDPLKPIIFYVDPTVPDVWRDAIRRGIELWQPAFEALGFRNTPRAVLPGSPEWPEDYDSGDIRFASVSFAVSQDHVFSVGPSVADPFTGEILDADIGFSQEWVRVFAGEVSMGELGMEQKSSIGKIGDAVHPKHVCTHKKDARLFQSRHHCQNARLRGRSLDANVLDGLAAKMRLLAATSLDGRVPMSVIADGLAGVTVHEVGHTLGLRHNFKGSAAIPYAKIYDGSYTKVHSSSGSVMDYVGAVIPPSESMQKSDKTIIFPDGHTIGAYDKLAIKYGYAVVEGESVTRHCL